jgi:hypothetical protein
VFNSTRIACGFTGRYVYDRVAALTMDSPRKRASGSVGLDLISLRCHCGKNLRSDNSRRPRGISLVDPSLVHTLSHWTSAKSWSSRKSEVGILEKLIIIRKYRLGQIHRCTDWPRPSNPCVAERRASWGEIEERSQKISENPPRQPSCKPQ